MLSRLAKSLPWLGLLGVVLFAFSPLWSAGFTGEDFRVLVQAGPRSAGAAGSVESERPPWELSIAELCAIEGEQGSLVGGLSLAFSRWAHGLPSGYGETVEAARAWRVENLVLLLLAGLGLRPFVRRLFLPWTGSEQARAAALAALALFWLHPLSPFAVASLAARGALLNTALVAWAGATFLAARQDRKAPLSFATAFLCLVAGANSDRALALPLILACAELVSAHRYRPWRERVRTTGTTLLVFGAITVVGALARGLETGVAPGETVRGSLARIATGDGAARALALGVEKLGVLVLPTNVHVAGAIGIALAGVLFLLAVQPGLLAARTAPRLWGWLLFAWFALVTVALLPLSPQRVHPGDLSRAGALIGAAAVMAIGLGLASTAVSGARRMLLPAGLALGYALLAQANARPFQDASRAAAELRRDVEAAWILHGRESRVLVTDPPAVVRGVDALGLWQDSGLGWLLHPAFADPARSGERSAPVDAIRRDALLALMREREFAALRAAPLVVVCPASELGSGVDSGRLPSGRRVSVPVAPPVASSGPRSWRGNSRSPDLDLDTLTCGALRVTAPQGVAPGTGLAVRMQPVSWRAREPAVDEGVHRGVWLGGADNPVAVFDLGSSLAWRLGGRALRIWFEGGLPTVSLAEVLDRLPRLDAGGPPLAPTPTDGDWVFERPRLAELGHPGLAAAAGSGRYVVSLLDLDRWSFVELPVEDLGPDRLRVEGAVDLVGEWVSRAVRDGREGAVAWSLDFRVGEVTVARASGRRVGRQGSREEDPGGL